MSVDIIYKQPKADWAYVSRLKWIGGVPVQAAGTYRCLDVNHKWLLPSNPYILNVSGIVFITRL